MPKTTAQIQSIIRLGGGISLDATNKTTSTLQSFARLANTNSEILIIRNADVKTVAELQSIARLAPGKVIFEL